VRRVLQGTTIPGQRASLTLTYVQSF
jgi:hypothetical protein